MQQRSTAGLDPGMLKHRFYPRDDERDGWWCERQGVDGVRIGSPGTTKKDTSYYLGLETDTNQSIYTSIRDITAVAHL